MTIALIFFVVSYFCGAWALYSFCKNCKDLPDICGSSPLLKPGKIVELNLLSIFFGWFLLIKFIVHGRNVNDFIRPIYRLRFGLRFWEVKPF